MIISGNEISHLIDRKDYSKLKLYVSLGYDLSLTDVNCDFVSKFGNSDHYAFKLLLSNSIDVLKKMKPKYLDIKNDKGYSLLHWAIIFHQNQIIKHLIEADVDIESITNTKETAISLAARFNNTN